MELLFFSQSSTSKGLLEDLEPTVACGSEVITLSQSLATGRVAAISLSVLVDSFAVIETPTSPVCEASFGAIVTLASIDLDCSTLLSTLDVLARL